MNNPGRSRNVSLSKIVPRNLILRDCSQTSKTALKVGGGEGRRGVAEGVKEGGGG